MPEKGRNVPRKTVEGTKPICGRLYADDAGIVSRSWNILANMMTVAVAVCAACGLIVADAKTETMCLMTKGMDWGTCVIEAAGQVYKQTAMFVHLVATVCENADLTVEINRCVLLTNLRFRRYGL